jgi:hypothetical protein
MTTRSVSGALKLLVTGLGTLIFCAPAFSQTVRPLIDELGNPAKGRVEYVNDSLFPLNVVLEAKSFTVSETGDISYRALDSNIHLKLSATSFRVQPQQTYYVFYEAKSATPDPAWFVIYASFSGFPFRAQQGMNVRLLLPHTVYLLPKQRVEKPDIHVVRAQLNATENKVVVEVENTGPNFGRVLETQLLYTNKKQEASGFPVFPYAKRILEIPLEQKAQGENVPIDVSFEFGGFKIEQKLERQGGVASAAWAQAPNGVPAAGTEVAIKP